MFLVDTNVWLEALLEQERSAEARRFLLSTDGYRLAITDFALHSIGVVLGRLGEGALFQRFLTDTFERAGVVIVVLGTSDLHRIPELQAGLGLDFDDAYQYLAAEKHGLTLVSFDSDFDRTELGRKTPGEATEPSVSPTDAPEA